MRKGKVTSVPPRQQAFKESIGTAPRGLNFCSKLQDPTILT
jgi:hypothetical protein